jgi:hypothetical protein
LRRNQGQFGIDIKACLANQLGHRGSVETGCVVLHPEGVSRTIKCETTDAIDFSRVRERKSHRLCGRSLESEKNIHRGHIWMIAAILRQKSRRTFPNPLEALQVAANFWVGPVSRADEFPADHTVAVDGICFRPHVRVEKAGCALAGVADGHEVDVAIPDKAGIRIWIVVDAYREDHHVGILMMELLERRQFFDARGTLAPPEVQKHNFAAVIGKMN